jgi:hypothetical protein
LYALGIQTAHNLSPLTCNPLHSCCYTYLMCSTFYKIQNTWWHIIFIVKCCSTNVANYFNINCRKPFNIVNCLNLPYFDFCALDLSCSMVGLSFVDQKYFLTFVAINHTWSCSQCSEIPSQISRQISKCHIRCKGNCSVWQIVSRYRNRAWLKFNFH